MFRVGYVVLVTGVNWAGNSGFEGCIGRIVGKLSRGGDYSVVLFNRPKYIPLSGDSTKERIMNAVHKSLQWKDGEILGIDILDLEQKVKGILTKPNTYDI